MQAGDQTSLAIASAGRVVVQCQRQPRSRGRDLAAELEGMASGILTATQRQEAMILNSVAFARFAECNSTPR